jgi:hypothetical protein
MAKQFNFQLLGLDEALAETRARIALIGLSNGGKTKSALRLARGIGKKTVVIDTEKRTSAKYLKEFTRDGFPYQIVPLGDKDGRTGRRDYSPEAYINAIDFVEKNGYGTCIIDSLSHAWIGEGGELDMVNDAEDKKKVKNSYFAWRDVTPWHNKLIDAMLQSDMHIIVTMRAKTEYQIENIGGKQVPKKIGMAPIMRDGLEYEFDIVFELDMDHNAVVTKTRCSEIDGLIFRPLDEKVGVLISEWVSGTPDPRRQPLPEEEVSKVKDLARQIGPEAEQAVLDTLQRRVISGSNEYLTIDTLKTNLIPRLEAKVAELKKVQTGE